MSDSPCWHCKMRTVVPNCHADCKEYLAFLDGKKAERIAKEKTVNALYDLSAVKRRCRALSKEIKARARGEKK